MLQAVDATAGGAFLAGGNETRILARASLLAAGAAATAIIREGTGAGRILAVLGAGIGGADHWAGPIAFRGAVFVTLTGVPTACVVYEG